MADLQTIPVVAPLVLPVAQPPSPTSVQPPMSQPPPLPEAPLGDAGQKRALEEDEAQKRALLDEEDAGKRKARRVQVKNKCEHGCWKDGRCKDCLCKHKVKRGDCKDGCNEFSRIFCIHDRRKHGCKECFPSSFCEHGRKKRRCRECSDPAHSDFCPHSRRKGQCKECGGSQICEHNRQKFRCKDCYMCVHYRVRSRCPDCIAEEMKNVVLQMPRGQGWNIKRPSLDSDAGALVNAVRDGEAGSTSRDASRKDFRADARSKKTEGLLLEAAASKSTLPGAVIGSMGMAGDPKSPEVGNGSEFELRQQIDTLRAQHAHAASSYFADKAKMQAEISRLQAENKDLRSLLAARGIAPPASQGGGGPGLLHGMATMTAMEQPPLPPTQPPPALP